MADHAFCMRRKCRRLAPPWWPRPWWLRPLNYRLSEWFTVYDEMAARPTASGLQGWKPVGRRVMCCLRCGWRSPWQTHEEFRQALKVGD